MASYLKKHQVNLAPSDSESKSDSLKALIGHKYGRQNIVSLHKDAKIEVVADTMEAVFNIAAQKMEVDISALEYEVLRQGKKGWFGFGKSPYKVLFYRNKSFKGAANTSSKNKESFEMHVSKKRLDGWVEAYVTKGGKFIVVHPPQKNGTKVTDSDVLHALESIHAEVETERVKSFLKKSHGKPIWVGEWIPDPLRDAQVEVEISWDKMKAFIKYIALLSGGRLLDKADVMEKLHESHIIYNVKEEAIQDFLNKKHSNTPNLIAEGTLMVPGKDAEINPKIELNKVSSYLEDQKEDKIDFRDVSSLVSVMKDQILVEKNTPVLGKDGMNVFGEVIPTTAGRDIILNGGKNTYVTEDGLQLKASLNGHAVMVGNVMHVEEVYIVRGDVGPVTGHITSLSSVVVIGSVLSGYNIKSAGNIEVRKDVGRSILEAEGDIIIRLGVNGAGHAKLISQKGHIHAKYLQDCAVKAKSEIVVKESILNSRVSTDDRVVLNGKKSAIMGGTIRALRAVICKTIGSPAGLQTRIEVGILPEVRAALASYLSRMNVFEEKIDDLNRQITILSHGDLNDQKRKQIRDLQERIQVLRDVNIQDMDRSQKLKEFIKQSYETVQGEIVALKRIVGGASFSCNAGFMEVLKEQGSSRCMQDVENPEYVKLEPLNAKQIRRYHVS